MVGYWSKIEQHNAAVAQLQLGTEGATFVPSHIISTTLQFLNLESVSSKHVRLTLLYVLVSIFVLKSVSGTSTRLTYMYIRYCQLSSQRTLHNIIDGRTTSRYTTQLHGVQADSSFAGTKHEPIHLPVTLRVDFTRVVKTISDTGNNDGIIKVELNHPNSIW